jgi:Kef-type K+ transport system membrane component KefB
MGLGYLVGVWWGFPPLVAIFLGATLTATSVGITARVLSDLGRLKEASSKVILGAAVIDDILGLIILALVAGLAETGQVSTGGVARALATAVVFLVLAIVLGIRFAPTLLQWVGRMRARGSLIVYAVLFCLILAVISARIGLATIIGAFAAGLVLAKTERRAHIEDLIKPVADLFVPIFVVGVGMQVRPAALSPFGEATRAVLWFALLLSAVAVVSKLAAGLVVYQRGVRRWPVGVGMIPRGEVGLIFAGIGLSRGVIDQGLYAACVGMVMITTIIAPLWLQAVYRKRPG